jgi:multicomponent K+:H+ antiporter subunit D
VSGLFGAIALMRVGDAPLLDRPGPPAPRLRVIETLPIAGLLAASMALVLQADAGLAYSRAAADSCMRPACTLMQ